MMAYKTTSAGDEIPRRHDQGSIENRDEALKSFGTADYLGQILPVQYGTRGSTQAISMPTTTFPFLRQPDHTFIIADIGKNFIQTADDRPVEEYLMNAKQLIDAAVNAGVDAVKFQTHEVEDEQLNIDVTSPHFKALDRYRWVKRNTEATPLHFWQELKAYCDANGTLFFSTPMSRKAARKLTKVDVPLWKVASGDVFDFVLLNELTRTKKPIILSSGMINLAELKTIISYLRLQGALPSILYCISQYPAPKEYFNLATIEHLKETYPDLTIGFSDHSLGHDIALAAVKVGTRIVEKHFSFSRDLWGPDHKVSMTPAEMKAMVAAIRSNAFKDIDLSPYYGYKEKELEGATNEFRPYFFKSLVAGTDVAAGSILTEEMTFAMRPQLAGLGLPSQELPNVIGKTVSKDLKTYDPITPAILAVS